MQRTVRRPRRLRGTLRVPGDKSISHRAALLGALATGRSRVRGFLAGEDCLATLDCLARLGVRWQLQGDTLEIEGVGLRGLREPDDVLNCANSGTTMRLLAGVLAGQPFVSVLTGDASLRSRPMGRVIEPLRAMGAAISGRAGDTLAPLTIRGGDLRGIRYRLPVASAQVKSAVLLAGLVAAGDTLLEEPALSRDHTERMLQAAGVDVRREGPLIRLTPPARLAPQDRTIPGDFSSAAFWIVAGAVHPDAELRLAGVGLNPTRLGLLDALRAMGADIEIEEEGVAGGEPAGDIVVRSSRLRGTEIAGDMVPRLIDEAPALAVAACFAEGRTVLRDATELRVKESDRIATVARELRKLGAEVEELPDGLVVEGRGALRGAVVDSSGDHRLAMALAIAGLVAEGETRVAGAEAVDVSYPAFWHDLETVAATA